MPENRTPVEKPKHAGGRPLKFKTPEELQAKIDAYFESCFADTWVRDRKGIILLNEAGSPCIERQQVKPFLITGLANALDVDRKTIVNYSNRDEFFPSIMRARRKCEEYAEAQLYDGNDRGAKFVLTNNYEWADRQEIGLEGSVRHSRESDLDKLSTDELKSLQLLLDKAKVE